MISGLFISLISIVKLSNALGDFPCAGTTGSQSCALWSVDVQRQGNISATAVCQPDPVNPTVSYCGYANAPCSTGADCDYGSCGTNGICQGYLGDACPNGSTDCQAFFFCGSNGTCGSAGAPCANSDAVPAIPLPNNQCVSGTCNTASMTCSTPPSLGVADGSACGVSSICASGFCSTSYTCAAVPNAAASASATLTPSALAASKKRKRFVTGGIEVVECAKGLTACQVGSWLSQGYECVDSKTSLEQCGGCVTDGQGQDCAAIPGVEGVLCQGGHCLILSCRPGMELSNNGHACVSKY